MVVWQHCCVHVVISLPYYCGGYVTALLCSRRHVPPLLLRWLCDSTAACTSSYPSPCVLLWWLCEGTPACTSSYPSPVRIIVVVVWRHCCVHAVISPSPFPLIIMKISRLIGPALIYTYGKTKSSLCFLIRRTSQVRAKKDGHRTRNVIISLPYSSDDLPLCLITCTCHAHKHVTMYAN